MAEPQDLWRKFEEFSVIGGIAEFGERQQAAPRRRPVEAGFLRDIGDGEPRFCLAEGLDDPEPLGEAADEIPLPAP
jgi:hypothetical protein